MITYFSGIIIRDKETGLKLTGVAEIDISWTFALFGCSGDKFSSDNM